MHLQMKKIDTRRRKTFRWKKVIQEAEKLSRLCQRMQDIFIKENDGFHNIFSFCSAFCVFFFKINTIFHALTIYALIGFHHSFLVFSLIFFSMITVYQFFDSVFSCVVSDFSVSNFICKMNEVTVWWAGIPYLHTTCSFQKLGHMLSRAHFNVSSWWDMNLSNWPQIFISDNGFENVCIAWFDKCLFSQRIFLISCTFSLESLFHIYSGFS